MLICRSSPCPRWLQAPAISAPSTYSCGPLILTTQSPQRRKLSKCCSRVAKVEKISTRSGRGTRIVVTRWSDNWKRDPELQCVSFSYPVAHTKVLVVYFLHRKSPKQTIRLSNTTMFPNPPSASVSGMVPCTSMGNSALTCTMFKILWP